MRSKGLRVSLTEAKKLGVTEEVLKPLRQAKRIRDEANMPQKRLYDALHPVLGDKLKWEKSALIEGRAFRADLYVPHVLLVIEVNGWTVHAKYLKDFLRTQRRHNAFAKRGFRLLHIPAGDVNKNIQGVCDEIIECVTALEVLMMSDNWLRTNKKQSFDE